MKLVLSLPFTALLTAASVSAAAQQAPAVTATAGSGTTLLVDRAKAVPAGAPVRGQSSTQVLARYGEPQQKPAPEGGQKQQWPTINRWVYPQFTVYFEKDKVIDVVVNQASAGEIGPAPATASGSDAPAVAPRRHHPKKHAAAKTAAGDVSATPASASPPAH